MFGFLKDKLKTWVDKVKGKVEEKIKPEQEVEEKKVKFKGKKPEKIERVKPQVKEDKKKGEKTKEELKTERETTDKLIQDISKEKLEIKTPEEKFEEKITEKEEKETGIKEEKKGFFSKLKKIFTSYTLNQEDFDEIFSDLELGLLENNVALEVVEKIREDLSKELVGKEIKKSEIEQEVKNALKNSIENILIEPENLIEQIKNHRKNSKEPYKILFFGINGAGKTTSIAKLTNLLQKNKFSCILAAGDTFRAASIEQLEIHANKLQVNIVKHTYGSDPSAVAFDAIKLAEKNNIDVVLIDTAGRMHTKDNLLKEMEKICRVTKPNLKVFVAEAVAGNDATEQAKAFNDIAGIDGSILSKVDVDEKGGTILSIGFITKKPILYLGIGQEYNDLELFNKKKFIEKLGL